MKLFVGLDIRSEKIDACFMTDDSNLSILNRLSVANDLNGASEIKALILKHHAEVSFEQIVIGMESTSLYSFHPAMFFQEDADLNALPTVVTVENPFKIKQYSRVFDEDKTDTNDAMRIADYLRIQRFTTSPIKEEKYMALQRLTRTRYQLVTELVTVKQHFLENLTYKCNTLSKELKSESTGIFSATIVHLMTENYSLDELANLPLEDFVQLIQNVGRSNFKNPEKLVKTIQRAIKNSYQLPRLMNESIDIILSTLVVQMRSLQQSIKQIDKGIEKLVEIIPEYQCLTSVPGIGKVYAAGILAEVGQIERFDDQAKVAKYAGLSWKVKQSGNYQSEVTPLTKQGNHYLRYYLVEAANSVKNHLPEYTAFYKKKYTETPINKHRRAIVLTARKFVRLVDALLRNHQLYTPPKSVLKE